MLCERGDERALILRLFSQESDAVPVFSVFSLFTLAKLAVSTRALVSVASVWEVAIKHRSGKLPVDPVSFRDECLGAGATTLRKFITLKFGDIPETASKRLEQATDEELDTWVEQILTANALDDLFRTR